MNRDPFIPILTYHGLSRGKGASGNGVYTLDEDRFQAQMTYLAGHRFHVLSLEEMLTPLSGKPIHRKSVVLTFDDGSESDFSIAVPILKRHHFPAAFFVNPGTLDQKGTLTAEDLKKMRREGMEIGSHGFDHLFLTRLDEKNLRHQIVGSKARLEALLGSPVPLFSIPRGRYNRKVLDMARQGGYRAVCTSDIGFNRLGSDPFCLRRWAMKRSYTLGDFISIVEGKPGGRLSVDYLLKQSAYRVLGHALYERIRTGVLREGT